MIRDRRWDRPWGLATPGASTPVRSHHPCAAHGPGVAAPLNRLISAALGVRLSWDGSRCPVVVPSVMVRGIRAAEELLPPDSHDQVVDLSNVSWEDDERIDALRGESAIPRLTYVEGVLELISPGTPHESVITWAPAFTAAATTCRSFASFCIAAMSGW